VLAGASAPRDRVAHAAKHAAASALAGRSSHSPGRCAKSAAHSGSQTTSALLDVYYFSSKITRVFKLFEFQLFLLNLTVRTVLLH